MIGARQRHFVERLEELATPCAQRAVVQLAEAHDYARDAQADPWQFAVEVESLVALGATVDDLNRLVHGGFVEHAREVTRLSDASRRFAPPRGLNITKNTCFILTAAGLRLTCRGPAWTPQRRAA
jgi:hypothetical protein